VEGQRPSLPDVLPGCHPSIRQLITACWADSPHQRPSSRELLQLATQLLEEHEAGRQQGQEGQPVGMGLALQAQAGT
jgi:hypothetical protein